MKKLNIESANGNFLEIQNKINELVAGYNKLAKVKDEEESDNK